MPRFGDGVTEYERLERGKNLSLEAPNSFGHASALFDMVKRLPEDHYLQLKNTHFTLTHLTIFEGPGPICLRHCN